MASQRHSCPRCGSIDVVLAESGSILSVNGKTDKIAVCPNCTWEGPASETVGFVTSEKVWDIQAIAEVSLNVIARHAAGPLIQLWEFVGIVPKMKLVSDEIPRAIRRKNEKHNDKVQKVRDKVLRATIAGALEQAFTTAQECRETYPELFAVEEPETETTEETN